MSQPISMIFFCGLGQPIGWSHSSATALGAAKAARKAMTPTNPAHLCLEQIP